MRHLDLLRRFLLKTIGGKNWVQKLLEGSEDAQQTQPKTKNPIVSTERSVKSEQPSGLLTQEIEKDVLFGCESANVSTERLVNSCVPASVERLDKDKDADAHQMRTRRPVKSGQSIGLFTQREEINIDFRVSGLPHAVVKQAENFRVRELVKKIVSHPLREAFQAHLQQNNVYNPFSDDSKAMIRETGDVELFELCKTTPKVQCSESLLWLESRNDIIALVDISWLKANPAKIFTSGDWMLSQIPHCVIKKGRPRGARHGKTACRTRV